MITSSLTGACSSQNCRSKIAQGSEESFSLSSSLGSSSASPFPRDSQELPCSEARQVLSAVDVPFMFSALFPYAK